MTIVKHHFAGRVFVIEHGLASEAINAQRIGRLGKRLSQVLREWEKIKGKRKAKRGARKKPKTCCCAWLATRALLIQQLPHLEPTRL